jgi:glycosyltransferase involved in cell wall biosynthesis
MKVLFLEAVQNFGGARKSTLELAKNLKDNGDDVLIIDLWGSCVPFLEEARQFNVPVKFIDKRDAPIILSHPNIFILFSNYIKYFFKWITYRKKISDYIKDFKVDLVIVNNTKTLSLLNSSKYYKIAYFARGWFLPQTVSFINSQIIKKIANTYIGVSQATGQALYAGGFAKLEDIYVVPNAIDYNEFQNLFNEVDAIKSWDKETSERPFIILHCGGFLETKGQHISLKIANELKKLNINFKIKIVGIVYKGVASEKYLDKINKEIINQNLENEIEIVLNKNKVGDNFVKSDVLIHPSSTEGLPRVVMEAMCLGKPVIANAVGGVTDFVSHGYTGFLANFNNVEEYVEYIRLLISNKEKYNHISENCKNLIKTSYTKENQYNAFIKIK